MSTAKKYILSFIKVRVFIDDDLYFVSVNVILNNFVVCFLIILLIRVLDMVKMQRI